MPNEVVSQSTFADDGGAKGPVYLDTSPEDFTGDGGIGATCIWYCCERDGR